jgi:hypothetical protein
MGGMFSVVKVRDDVRPGDYKEPAPYKHPAGTVSYEFQGEVQQPARAPSPAADANTLNVRKPSGAHTGH